MKTTISEKKWADVIRLAIALAEAKVLGTLGDKDERVAKLRAQVQNPSNLDLAVGENKQMAERNRETLRRDFRHWGIKASFRKNVGGIVQDLSGAAVALAFGGYDAQLVNAVRRLVVLTGIQPEWVSRIWDERKGDFFYEDQDGNPTVAALMSPAKAKLVETPAEPAADDDIVAALLREGTVDVERQRNIDAFEFVEKWLLAGGKPKGKPAAQQPATATKPTDAKNAEALAAAANLVAAGQGMLSPEGQALVDAATDVDDSAEDDVDGSIVMREIDGGVHNGMHTTIKIMALKSDFAPTFEEQLVAAETDEATAASEKRYADAGAAAERATSIRAAIVERDRQAAEAAARQAEAKRIAREAEAEAALTVEPMVAEASAGAAPAQVNTDFEALKGLARGGNARAQKLVGSVIDGARTEADAVDLAKTVGLIS